MVKRTQYDNGMGMTCYKYEFDTIQEKDGYKYDTLLIESDTNNLFGQYFVYHFYQLNGKIVHSETY